MIKIVIIFLIINTISASILNLYRWLHVVVHPGTTAMLEQRQRRRRKFTPSMRVCVIVLALAFFSFVATITVQHHSLFVDLLASMDVNVRTWTNKMLGRTSDIGGDSDSDSNSNSENDNNPTTSSLVSAATFSMGRYTYDLRGNSPRESKAKHESSRLWTEFDQDVQKITLLENITVGPLLGQLYTVLHDSEDFTSDKFAFMVRPPNSIASSSRLLIRAYFLINGNVICGSVSSPYIIIVIPTLVNHFEKRQAIRETWMGAAISNDWPRAKIDKNVRHVFFMGIQSNFSQDALHELQEEYKTFGDIVLVNIPEFYRNLSKKMLMALQWVQQYCPQADYVMKSDEDTFVNIPLLIQVLSYIAVKSKTSTFVVGKAHTSVKPRVVRGGRWGVSKEEYPLEHFPRYLYGHSYVISRAGISALVRSSRRVKVIPAEDVYLTGILPKLAGVTRVGALCFTVCCIDLFDCDVVWNQFVSLTAASSPDDHKLLWKSVTEGKCQPNIPFNENKRYNSTGHRKKTRPPKENNE